MSFFANALDVQPYILPEMSREISPWDLSAIWKLYRLFVRHRPALIHTHSAKAGTVGRIAGFLYRWLTPQALVGRPRPCRFVHTFHGHVFHGYYGRWKSGLFVRIERALARATTDRIVVISPRLRQEIQEQYGVGKPGQFSIIPLGLDLTVYTGAASRRHVLREELGVTADELLVGIVGRLTEIKNHSLFLQIAARLRRDHPAMAHNVRFLVIGDGHLRAALETEARTLGIDDRVTFLGMRPDPENFYPALDLIALTSRNEGTPLTLIEGMANARAAIATDVGGVVDLLGPAREESAEGGSQLCERGLLIPPNDAKTFTEGMVRLLKDAELRLRLGERGRVFVENYYSKERLLRDIADLYDSLLAGRATKEAQALTDSLTPSSQNG